MTEYIVPPHLSPDRFQKGLHFVPMEKSGMVELSFLERFNLMESICPDIRYYWNPRLSSTKTDIECLLDNNRVPTHREMDVVLSPSSAAEFNITPLNFNITQPESSEKFIAAITGSGLRALYISKETIVRKLSDIGGVMEESPVSILETDFNKSKEI